VFLGRFDLLQRALLAELHDHVGSSSVSSFPAALLGPAARLRGV
jgi:hypothetical protein